MRAPFHFVLSLSYHFDAVRGRAPALRIMRDAVGGDSHDTHGALEATQLLLATNKSVKEIGACVGFAVQNSFVRAFRKSVGVSPGEYRRLKTAPADAPASEAPRKGIGR